MKNILVPTDFSEHSQYAINAAVKVAEKHGSVIHFMHTIKSLGDIVQLDSFASGDFASTTVSTDQILQLIELKTEEAENNLKTLKKQIEEKGINAITHVKQEAIDIAINKVVKEHHIDMVIMGSHGASGFAEMIIGSNAQKVVRNSKCPVLILKNELTSDLEHLVYASNFDEEEVNKNIPRAGALADSLSAKMHFLFVNTPGYFEDTESTLKKIKEACKLYPDADKHIYNDFSVEDGILAFSKMNNMNSIVITTHGYKALSRFFNNNIAEHLVNHCDIPVISLNLEK